MESPLFLLRCGARCRERRYQRGRINKGRSPQNCIARGWVSARLSDAILRDDELICAMSRAWVLATCINKLVTPRRGTHKGGESWELLCPDVGVFRCFASLRCGYTPLWGAMSRAQVSARSINKGRSPQNCIDCGWVSARLSDAILRDEVYINTLVTPHGRVSARLSDAILRDDELICFTVAVGEQGLALPQASICQWDRGERLHAFSGKII